jgi:hypothetical protein
MKETTESAISFRIRRGEVSRQFRCIVRNEGNHEITLTGESCHNRKDVLKMIHTHISAILEGRYVIITEDSAKPAAKKRPKEGKISRPWP